MTTVEKTPPSQGWFLVLVPDDFEAGKSIMRWALQKVHKNSESLVVVHVHGCDEQTGLNDAKEKLDEYAGMCKKMKVKFDVLPIEDDDVVKVLREHIELKHMTNLVIGVEDKHYSEKTKSLNSKTAIRLMQTEAPSCKTRYITCDGDLICTRRIKHSPMLIPDGLAFHLQMVETKREKCLRKLREVAVKISYLNHKLDMLKEKPWSGSPKRYAERIQKEKRYERQWKDANEEKLRLKKQIEECKSYIELIKGISKNMPIAQERDTAVTEAGGLDEKNGVETTMAWPAETMSPDFYDKHEIDESMLCFDSTLMGEEGGSGTVQKGLLRGIVVAMKMRHRESMQEFLGKVETKREKCLRKLREVVVKNFYLKHKLDMLKEKPWSGSPKRYAERIEKKRYERQWKDANGLKKQIEECESYIELIKGISKNMPIAQERDTAVTEAGGLDEKNGVETTMAWPAETMSPDFYDKHEIDESMLCFDSTLMGEEGGSGSVQKGLLRGTVVAIKMRHRESMQEFLGKVAVLARVRHPSLVTLMGVCKEAFAQVYEFLPNGSLQDWLERRKEMATLTWLERTKIILDIRRVLIFLHTNKPQPVVHGNLKPSKVLLDCNLACKLEASGISQSNNGGKPATKHDVQSFGIIILQLLTRQDVAEVVEEAMKKGGLDSVLDDTAGKWPPALAIQLARCGVEMRQEECPDLLGDVWKVLESLINADILTSGQDDDGTPNHFLCPISGDVMKRPHVAADGYSYDYDKIMRLFLRRPNGSVTVKSPITRLDLENLKLIPNFPLKSAIEQWKVEKQQQQMTQVRSLVNDDSHPVQISSQVHPIIVTPEEEAESQPAATGLLLPPASNNAHSHSIIAPPNASDDPPTGIRRRHVTNGRPLSLTTEADLAGPGESSRIVPGKFIKHE